MPKVTRHAWIGSHIPLTPLFTFEMVTPKACGLFQTLWNGWAGAFPQVRQTGFWGQVTVRVWEERGGVCGSTGSVTPGGRENCSQDWSLSFCSQGLAQWP